MEILKFRRVLPNSETPRSESNIENLLLQPHPEEVRRLAGGEGPVVAVLLERHRRGPVADRLRADDCSREVRVSEPVIGELLMPHENE